MDYRRKHISRFLIPIPFPLTLLLFFLTYLAIHHPPTIKPTKLDHWQDVTVGSLLGIFVAFFSYRQYYPSLAATESQKPYSPRIRAENAILPLHEPMLSSVPSNGSGGRTRLNGGSEGYRDPYLHERNSLEMDPPRLPVIKPESESLTEGWKSHDEQPTHDFGRADRA